MLVYDKQATIIMIGWWWSGTTWLEKIPAMSHEKFSPFPIPKKTGWLIVIPIMFVIIPIEPDSIIPLK